MRITARILVKNPCNPVIAEVEITDEDIEQIARKEFEISDEIGIEVRKITMVCQAEERD